jgi:hypothetical protein
MGTKRPKLTVAQVLRWADAHHRRTGRWPGAHSGPVAGAPGEIWRNINGALRQGFRGLSGGETLAQLLVRHDRRPRRWDRGAWTAAEDQLIRTLAPAEAARRTGRPLTAVYERRRQLRLHNARKERG